VGRHREAALRNLRAGDGLTVLRNPWLRLSFVLAGIAGVVALLVFHGPNWHTVGEAFTAVRWKWVVIAIGFNLLSVLARAFAWTQVIDAAIPKPWPRFRSIFSAFSVGLMANAVLPGRIGELARVAVLVRKLPRRRGLWATLVGTVFAHRVFDIAPVVLLILYVVITAKIPAWATTSLIVFVAAGIGLFAFAFASAKLPQRTRIDGLGAARRVVTMARQGLGVMRIGPRAGLAVLFQILGWLCQLLAVYTAMRAFHIHSPLPAAGLVLVLMNVATIFPLWPGNIGLVQIAIATPLTQYGVAYARGVAYGFGLQAIEASVGIGAGLIFLAREGLSFAMLRVMPGAEQADQGSPEEIDEPARTGVPG
jgi:uncharacterized protein (TIRG00374 family)